MNLNKRLFYILFPSGRFLNTSQGSLLLSDAIKEARRHQQRLPEGRSGRSVGRTTSRSGHGGQAATATTTSSLHGGGGGKKAKICLTGSTIRHIRHCIQMFWKSNNNCCEIFFLKMQFVTPRFGHLGSGWPDIGFVTLYVINKFATIIVFIFETFGYNVECDGLCSRSNKSLQKGRNQRPTNEHWTVVLSQMASIQCSR